jgi:hypothetical protein
MDFPGGRRLDLAKAGSIDVRPDETRSTKGNRSARAFLFSIVPEASEGSTGEASSSRKSCCALPAPRESAGAAASRPEAGDVPSKHGAVGGRMTARWSGVLHERRRRRRARGGSRSGTSAGFPTALCGQSPKRVFLRRVLVSETSVVEADSKHLGDASKESREALRGAHRQATGRRGARNGAHRHSLRARVQRLAKVERPA